MASRFRSGRSCPHVHTFLILGAADAFLLDVSYGAEWHAETQRLQLLAETHDTWRAQAGSCRTHRYAFLEGLDGALPQADHVITMTNIPHYFALCGTRQQRETTRSPPVR